ncbi:protamine-like protein 99C [Drosophila obscura]|uniref:protamine-like protein 99C n=1 Tax=Drosophila obscura TaxID=7282 RepID=UPI001BB25992|nr:protamine-like protein 99C [Drosophila obscura]
MGCAKKKYAPQHVGRVTKNGYLNFLRDYKKKHCGLSPRQMVSKGAKAWNGLTCKQKDRYRKMGCKKSRRPKKATEKKTTIVTEGKGRLSAGREDGLTSRSIDFNANFVDHDGAVGE